MSGTAATDTTARVIPGAGLFSEWTVRLNGFIATCVESAELIIKGIYQATPLTPANDRALATDLIQRGQASASGATNWYAASQQLARQGIPNTPYGPDFFAHQDWQASLNAALAQGKPVLFGLSNATALHDDFTGQYFDRGVSGHAITIVGRDATGYLAVDPNQNPATQALTHYTASNLAAAGASSMDIPTNAPQGNGQPSGTITSPFIGGPISNLTGASTADIWSVIQSIAGNVIPGSNTPNDTGSGSGSGSGGGSGSFWSNPFNLINAILPLEAAAGIASINDAMNRAFQFIVGILLIWLGIHLVATR